MRKKLKVLTGFILHVTIGTKNVSKIHVSTTITLNEICLWQILQFPIIWKSP